MAREPIEVIKNSFIYRALARAYRWADGSSFVNLISEERVIAGVLGVFISLSVVRVLASDVHVTIQFLSFLLLFVVTAAVTWNYTEPLADA